MNTSSLDDAFERWRGALLDALQNPDAVMSWQDRRYRFAYQVGQLLVGSTGPSNPPVTGPALYGVYVTGGGLLYIGQTGDARRRLRDLPVGESHHLATTVPPETWERIVVVQWPILIASVPSAEVQAAERLGLQVCGLAMEHLLQVMYRPVMTTRRRGAAGGWSARNLDASHSLGAISSTEFPHLFTAVHNAWEDLAGMPTAAGDHGASYTEVGRVVFPATLLGPRTSHSPAPQRALADEDVRVAGRPGMGTRHSGR